jgi:hypothetical protein
LRDARWSGTRRGVRWQAQCAPVEDASSISARHIDRHHLFANVRQTNERHMAGYGLLVLILTYACMGGHLLYSLFVLRARPM